MVNNNGPARQNGLRAACLSPLRRGLMICLLLIAGPALAEPVVAPDFSGWQPWLEGLKTRASAEGIADATLESAFAGLEPDPRVIRFDRRQPEFVQTLDQYLGARLNTTRINRARTMHLQHRQKLAAITDVYGVPPEVIMAFWGLESNFGQYQGKYSIVRSLATLSYDLRRREFFTGQLMQALHILDEGHVAPDKFVGGWAGAMGQNQFMPASFNNYAVDFDGDGRKDIWQSEPDVWASIANYLTLHEWETGVSWGVEVSLPEDFDIAAYPGTSDRGCRANRSLSHFAPVSEWEAAGVELQDAGSREVFADAATTLALVPPEEGSNKTWLVSGNYSTILAYNCAHKYALSIGLLSDMVRD